LNFPGLSRQLDVSSDAPDIDDVWVRGGSQQGVDTLFVAAYGGKAWSEWDAFNLTTIA